MSRATKVVLVDAPANAVKGYLDEGNPLALPVEVVSEGQLAMKVMLVDSAEAGAVAIATPVEDFLLMWGDEAPGFFELWGDQAPGFLMLWGDSGG